MIKIILLFFYLQLFNLQEYDTKSYHHVEYQDFKKLKIQIDQSSLKDSLIKINDVYIKYPQIKRPECEADNTGECQNYIITISKFDRGNNFVRTLPTILLIGGIHGDETTGTNSLYRLVQIYLKYGKVNEYLNDLLDNVKFVILPMLNVEGFSSERREEKVKSKLYDPNRDFPFNVAFEEKCFKTGSSKLLDIILRQNVIIGAISFHGGENSITYPWGNFAHANQPKTGDHIAFSEVAEMMKQIAGHNTDLNIPYYKTGLMHDVVYDVNGGFVDWAYGASWDHKNVSKFCSQDKSYFPDLFRLGIKYPNFSNRVFAFLIETGFEKQPEEDSLGNELSIFEPDNPKSIWGHVSRNTYLALKFGEIISPQLEIDFVKYHKGLIFELSVRGCFKINNISVEDLRYLLISNKYIAKDGVHKIELVVTQVSKYIPEIKFKLECDHHWRKPVEHQMPQSHLVKMKTDPEYQINNEFAQLDNLSTLSIKLLNIFPTKIKDAYLMKANRYIFQYVYDKQYQIIIPGNEIYLDYEDNHLVFSSKVHEDFTLIFKKYATSSCCTTKTNGDNDLMVINTKDKLEMYQRSFYELLGRFVQFKSVETGELFFYSKIALRNHDQYSSLFIPPNGLTCNSENNKEYYYIKIVNFKLTGLDIQMFSNVQESFKLKFANGIEVNLNKQNISKSEKNIFVYETNFYAENYNQMRLWGLRLDLVDINDNPIYSCNLGLLNPEFDEWEHLNKLKTFKVIVKDVQFHKLIFTRSNNNEQIFLAFMCIFFLIILLVIFYFVKNIWKRNQRLQKVDNDDELYNEDN